VDVAKQPQEVAEPVQAGAERTTIKAAPQYPATLTPGRSSVDELLQRIHTRQWWTNLWLAVLAVPLALTFSLVCLTVIVPMVAGLSQEYLSGASDTATIAPPATYYAAPGQAAGAPLPTFVAPELQAKPTPYAAPAASKSAELAPLFSPEPASKSVSEK
jgi:hypothetical protein